MPDHRSRKRVARQTYEDFYRTLRTHYRSFDLTQTMHYAFREIARANRNRLPYLQYIALQIAFRDFLRNCPEIDVNSTFLRQALLQNSFALRHSRRQA